MTEDLFDVAGTVVLISGASRGIGKAIAAGFAERGAKAIITGRDEATLTATAKALGGIDHLVCDIADGGSIEACVEQTLARHGRIDTLVNVAGVNKRLPAEDYSEEDFDFIVDINLKGTYLISQAVGRHMIGRGGGCQINIDSLSSYAPLSRVLPYAMSKVAVSAMTRGLAAEWGPHGVRVNAIAPGFILTDLTQKVWADPGMRAWNDVVTPLRRLGTPEDMVGAALFLASSAAAFITGQVLRVDGGVSAGVHWPIAGDFRVEET